MDTSRKQLPRRPLFPGHKPPRALHGEIDRHGNEVWYFREGHGPRTRLRAPFASPQFIEEYHRAKYSRPGVGAAAPAFTMKGLSHKDPNSLQWLIDRYLASHYFATENEPATRKQHRSVLLRVAEKNGGKAFREFDWSNVKALRDHIAEYGSDPANPAPAPAMANRIVSVLRTLFDWAIEEEKLLEINPCLGVKKVKYAEKTNHPWTDAECDRFEAAYPPGTREYLAYALLTYTGQRSSDVVRMGPQHIDRQGCMTIVQQKTRKKVNVQVLPVLAEAIAAGPCGTETFIAKQDGTSINSEWFGAWLRAACDKIGVPECTPHGLRHAAATRALENGANMDYLMGVFGFSVQVAERYVRTAQLARAAKRGALHLVRSVA